MYTGFYSENKPNPSDYGAPNGTTSSYWQDSQQNTITVEGAKKSASRWLTNVPWAMHQLLMFITKRYSRPAVYITENGWSSKGKQTAATGTDDHDRIDYYSGHIAQVCKIRSWSLEVAPARAMVLHSARFAAGPPRDHGRRRCAGLFCLVAPR